MSVRGDVGRRRRRIMPAERREMISEMVRRSGSVTVAALEETFDISPMTARRDLAILEDEGRVKRIHGGAVLPGFARREDSFQRRLEENREAKERLARAALGMLGSGETLFVDSSTTAYYAARLILREGLEATILTNSLPVMSLFTTDEAPKVSLIGVGGTLRRLTLSFVGPRATGDVEAHFADRAFVSVKGVTPDGYLTDPDPLEAEVKRAMILHSEEPILLVDGGKFSQRGLNRIAHVSEVSTVLAADAPEQRLKEIAAGGTRVRRV